MKLSVLLESILHDHVRKITFGAETIPISYPLKTQVQLIPDPEILSIHFDSRDVKPGSLFIAIPGHKSDGHDYIDHAVSKGAVAVISQGPAEKNKVWSIEVENSRKALAVLSANFYGNPSEQLTIIGITGTNGKTTVSFLIEKILLEAGFSVGVIGTLNYRYCRKSLELSMTTPESPDLQKILADMLKEGVTHVVMEVSSHAIALDRIVSCWMDVAVFTNLTQDHLDFHKTIENYWSCKKSLFTEHLAIGPKKNKAVSVINCNDLRGKILFKEIDSAISVGFDEKFHLWSDSIVMDKTGSEGRISTPGGVFQFKSKLIGNHNIENILCAAGACLALGIGLDAIRKGIEAVDFVPGRLQFIPNDKKRFVFVDYAHTPDALENVLKTLKGLTKNRIICVFGCGGERDKGKRPLMGSIAASLADICIITSDNPRSEDPVVIMDDILKGVQAQGMLRHDPELEKTSSARGYFVEPDRYMAIYLAMKISMPGDIVLIAGKGHETYQIIGNEKISFDDSVIARKALSMQL